MVCPSLPLCWPVISEMWLPGARGGVLQALGSEEPHLGAALCLHSASALLWKVRAGRSELAVVPENLNSGTCL